MKFPVPAIVNTLIVEDELPSLERLKGQLGAFPQIRVMGEARDGEGAVAAINKLKPDLVFLDIELPEFNGFEVLNRISGMPMVVFVTAFNEYAVKAFEENAVDYLLKPTSGQRLQKCIDRILKERQKLEPELIADLRNLLQEPKRQTTNLLPVKCGDEVRFIPAGEVYYFQAEGKCVYLATHNRRHLYDATLKEIETKVEPERFARISKSAIVAIDKIEKLSRWFQGSYLAVMADENKTELKTGRAYLPALRQRLRF